MKKLFQMFKELIFKDVIRENEAKDTAVLLRSLALLSFAYHLAMFITSLRYLHLLESIYSALALFLIIVIFVAVFQFQHSSMKFIQFDRLYCTTYQRKMQ